MLKFSHSCPTTLQITGCPIFAFFGEGIFDVGSASDVEERHFTVPHFP